MTPLPKHGLYAITDRGLCERHGIIESVGRAIAGGARIVQYRDKTGDRSRRCSEAERLLELCREHAVPLLINDDLELAIALGADGVHLGKEDARAMEARERAGGSLIVGVSCYDSVSRARAAARGGASYVALGSFFPSPTKPLATPVSTQVLRECRAAVDLPIAAIGGLTPQNSAALVGLGVNYLAVISGVFGAPDPQDAARSYALLFEP